MFRRRQVLDADESARLHSRLESLGVLDLGRVAIGVDEQIIGAMVDGLERRAWFDMDQPTGRHVVSLRRFTEVHRQRAREDDECLLLEFVSMPAPDRAWVESPHVRPRVPNPGKVTQFGNVPRRLTRFVRPGDPVNTLELKDAEAHAPRLYGPRTDVG
jgi:hypothetical protein